MTNKLYVGNLSYQTSNDSLQDFFTQFGQVSEAVVIEDRQTGRSRGFGFVTFSTAEEAKAALALDGQELDGRELRVNIAAEREGGRSGGGNRGGYRGGQGGGGRGRWND